MDDKPLANEREALEGIEKFWNDSDIIPSTSVEATVNPKNVFAQPALNSVQATLPSQAMTLSTQRAGYVFEDMMLLHKPISSYDEDHPEIPDRILRIYQTLNEEGLLKRMVHISARRAQREEVCAVHSEDHWQGVQNFRTYTSTNFDEAQRQFAHESLYACNATPDAAEYSCGGAVEAALAVARGEVRTSFAIIRPPGHHAEPEKAMGFCFFNNAAVAARAIQAQTNIRRILIVDWDVHHGNGTQRAFYDDPSVLFISIHRHEGGTFYPTGPEGSMESCGVGEGLGRNINIPWPTGDMGDADYLYAFTRIILPVAYEFSPELVIISAGFDAARGDPLGGCDVTPTGYAHMTQLLSPLAGGKMVVLLEGGYELETIAKCSAAVVKVLLGDPAPMLDTMVASPEASETVYQVALLQGRFWKSLHPAALDPAQEVLKDHRRVDMQERWKMHTIGLATPSLEEYYHGQILLSRGIYDFQTIVVDASSRVVELCNKNRWGLIDINVVAKPQRGNSKAEAATMKQLLAYIWDNYVELSDARSVILLTQGAAIKGVQALISARMVRKKINAIIQVAPLHEAIPKFKLGTEDDIKAWFKACSLLIAPDSHPAMKERRVIDKRYQTVRLLPEVRVTKLLSLAISTIEGFVRDHLPQQMELD
ncbi:hypothetical protein DL93DRAFT_2163034 [Clavulina sp. PMI_390]|nr:hypothetical protein DL93DRAFT_2163034 [Clavulina sp. PMI_390]